MSKITFWFALLFMLLQNRLQNRQVWFGIDARVVGFSIGDIQQDQA